MHSMKQTNRIQIFNEDCVAGLFSVGKRFVDIIVTSPPYNLGIKYNEYKDKLKHEEYLQWIERVANSFSVCLNTKGHIFLNVSSTPLKPLLAYEILEKFLKYFKIQNTIHWVKNISIGDKSYGHFKPINSNRFLNHNHEFIFHLTRDGNVQINRLAIGVPFSDKSNIARWEKNILDLRCNGNVWHITYDTVNQKKEHPASFPVELPKKCIKLAGFDETTIVCDPFLGSGSTMVAAKELGCMFHGYEIDGKYFEACLNKI